MMTMMKVLIESRWYISFIIWWKCIYTTKWLHVSLPT